MQLQIRTTIVHDPNISKKCTHARVGQKRYSILSPETSRNHQKPIEAIGSVIWEPHWLIFIQDFQVRVFQGPSPNDPQNQCLSEKWRSVSRTLGATKRTLSQCLEKNGISQNWGTHGPTKSRGLGMLGV